MNEEKKRQQGVGGRVRKFFRRCDRLSNFFKTETDAAAPAGAGRENF